MADAQKNPPPSQGGDGKGCLLPASGEEVAPPVQASATLHNAEADGPLDKSLGRVNQTF